MSTTSPPDVAGAQDLKVFDYTGKQVTFGSLLSESGNTVVVFIRHFFCGICKMYVQDLGAMISQESLVKANTKIIVIGCGNWEPISSYAEETGFRGQIFADPTRKLYHTLGMNLEKLGRTPAGQKKKSYLREGALVNALKSIYKGPLSNPSLLGKQGNISQLGGDFVFGPNQEVIFFSRMQHTEDHVEVAELMKHAGVEL